MMPAADDDAHQAAAEQEQGCGFGDGRNWLGSKDNRREYEFAGIGTVRRTKVEIAGLSSACQVKGLCIQEAAVGIRQQCRGRPQSVKHFPVDVKVGGSIRCIACIGQVKDQDVASGRVAVISIESNLRLKFG